MKELFKLKEKISISVLSVIYSLLLVFGTSYMTKGNATLVFNNLFLSIIIFIILFFILRLFLLYLYKVLDKYQVKDKSNSKLSKFRKILNLHPFLVSFIVIILFWLPYIFAFYPAILSPDPSFQIKQYFGIPNKYMEYSVMLDEKVTITNHHPVLHTLLLGTSLKIGHSLGNDNFGLFIYSLIQISILSTTLAYTIKYLTKEKVSFKYRFIILLVYGLVPMFPLYSMSAVKDVIYSSLIILYTILMHYLLKKKETLKTRQLIYIFILLMFIILFRNNGYYVVFLSFPFLFINKVHLKKLLTIFILFVTFNYAYNDLILPFFRVTPSSIREVLSIPFQQTARYVKYNKVTKEEYLVYDKILDMSTLGQRYNPELSDPVKNKYNRYTTDAELKEYFYYWFKGFFKASGTYINATINNVYGYFYPLKTNWYVYYKYDTRIVGDGFNYHYNSLDSLRSILSTFGKSFIYIPVLGLISNIAFNTWIIFFMIAYAVYKNKKSFIIILLPSLVTILVCIASPANTYFRYAMPYIFSMPLLVGLFLQDTRLKSIKLKEKHGQSN